MKTSYFANLKKKEVKYPVSICGRAPQSWSGQEYKKLAPKYWFFKEFKDENSEHYQDKTWYEEQYEKEVLQSLDPDTVVKEICALYPEASEDEITLVCYEKTGDFCHRHLVASWLNKNGHPTTEI